MTLSARSELYRPVRENRAGNRVDVKLNEDDRRTIREIKKYLRNHFSQDITLKELSDKFYMNPSYISQLFKNELGMKYHDYLTRLRIDKAKNTACCNQEEYMRNFR